MIIKLNEPKQLMSHLLLANRVVAEAVANTPEHKAGEPIRAMVMFNGVEVPAEVMEDVLLSFWEQTQRAFEEKYSDHKQAVEREAKALLEEPLTSLIDKLNYLSDHIDGILPDTY